MTRVYVLVFVALGALAAATTALDRLYATARLDRAHRAYADGERLAAAGQRDAAIARYRNALVLSRDNADYTLALALTLLDERRYGEAENYLRDLLAAQPTNGPANRGLARVSARLGRLDDARIFYNRAIYGYWPSRARDERLATRFELVDLLRTADNRRELLAALLELDAEIDASDTATHLRVVDAYVAAGAADEAAALLTRMVGVHPRDARLWARLGEVEVARQHVADGARALARALRLGDTDDSVRAALARAQHVLAFDPTVPGLRSAERRRRQRALLAGVFAAFEHCRVSVEPGTPLAATLAEADRRRAAARRPAGDEPDDAEFALELWQALTAAGCAAEGPDAEALASVLQRITPAAEPATP